MSLQPSKYKVFTKQVYNHLIDEYGDDNMNVGVIMNHINNDELLRLLLKNVKRMQKVEIAFKIIRDQIIFTNLRLITIDKQGLTARKVDYRSIPYDKIVQFSKESAGILDLDAELKIWVASMSEPLKFEFSKDAPINDVYQLLSEKILKAS